MQVTQARKHRVRQQRPGRWLSWIALAVVLLGPVAASADGPARRSSVWPPGLLANPVPGNVEILKILDGHFEQSDVPVPGPFNTETKPFWYARAPAKGRTGRVLIYLHGDIPYQNRETVSFYRSIVAKRLPRYRALARANDTDIIFLVRPGYFMAPGNTLYRQAPPTLELITAAIAKLQTMYGYTSVAIAGQSGGASIAATLMMQPTLAPRCVVLASGFHYRAMKPDQRARLGRTFNAGGAPNGGSSASLPNSGAETDKTPSESSPVPTQERARTLPQRWQEFDAVSFDVGTNLERVRVDPARRVFVLGDRQDGVVPFAGQPKLVADLHALAHHARLLELPARGRQHHDLAADAVRIGLQCLNGATDADISAPVRAE
jgi:hypothetical protein